MAGASRVRSLSLPRRGEDMPDGVLSDMERAFKPLSTMCTWVSVLSVPALPWIALRQCRLVEQPTPLEPRRSGVERAACCLLDAQAILACAAVSFFPVFGLSWQPLLAMGSVGTLALGFAAQSAAANAVQAMYLVSFFRGGELWPRV